MQNFLCNQILVDYLEWGHMTLQWRYILADPYPKHLRHWWKVRYKIFLLGHLEHRHQNIHKYISKTYFVYGNSMTFYGSKDFLVELSTLKTEVRIRTMAVQSWTTLFGTLGGAQNFDLHSVGNGIESRVYSKQLKFSLPPAGSFVSSSHHAKHSLSSPQNIFNPFYGLKL